MSSIQHPQCLFMATVNLDDVCVCAWASLLLLSITRLFNLRKWEELLTAHLCTDRRSTGMAEESMFSTENASRHYGYQLFDSGSTFSKQKFFIAHHFWNELDENLLTLMTNRQKKNFLNNIWIDILSIWCAFLLLVSEKILLNAIKNGSCRQVILN